MKKKYQTSVMKNTKLLTPDDCSENNSCSSQGDVVAIEKKAIPNAPVKDPVLYYQSELEMLFAHHDI